MCSESADCREWKMKMWERLRKKCVPQLFFHGQEQKIYIQGGTKVCVCVSRWGEFWLLSRDEGLKKDTASWDVAIETRWLWKHLVELILLIWLVFSHREKPRSMMISRSPSTVEIKSLRKCSESGFAGSAKSLWVLANLSGPGLF